MDKDRVRRLESVPANDGPLMVDSGTLYDGVACEKHVFCLRLARHSGSLAITSYCTSMYL